MKIIEVLIAIFLFILIGCQNSLEDATGNEGNEIIPGSFSIKLLDGLAKTGSDQYTGSQASDTTAFNLGKIKASRDFYFMLLNSGNSDIHNIEISSSNPDFYVSPSFVQKISPSGISNIGTIIRVTVIHGKALDGVGYTRVLNAGTNSTQISFSGTTPNKDQIDIETSYFLDLTVDAQVLDITLLNGTTPVSLGSPSMNGSLITGGLGWVRIYTITGEIKIANTGNVDIDIYYFQNDLSAIPSAFAAPGDTVIVPDSLFSNGFCNVRLDGGNTISDYTRLQIGDDGAAYLGITRQSIPMPLEFDL